MINSEIIASVESQYFKSDDDYWTLLKDGILELEKRTTQTTYHLRLRKVSNIKPESPEQNEEIQIQMPSKLIKRSDNFYYFLEENSEDYCGLKFKNKKLAKEFIKRLKKAKGVGIVSEEEYNEISSRRSWFRKLFCCCCNDYEPKTKESEKKKKKRAKILENFVNFFRDDTANVNLKSKKYRKNKKKKHLSSDEDSGYSSGSSESSSEHDNSESETEKKKSKDKLKVTKKKEKKDSSDLNDETDSSSTESKSKEEKSRKNSIDKKKKSDDNLKEKKPTKDIKNESKKPVEKQKLSEKPKIEKNAKLQDTSKVNFAGKPNFLDGIKKFDKNNLKSNEPASIEKKNQGNADDLLKNEMAKRNKFLNDSDDD